MPGTTAVDRPSPISDDKNIWAPIWDSVKCVLLRGLHDGDARAARCHPEVAAGWVASEELEGFAPHPGTGDERASLRQEATPEEASRALEKVRTRLAECDVFKKVLRGARGSRSLAGEWHRSEVSVLCGTTPGVLLARRRTARHRATY